MANVTFNKGLILVVLTLLFSLTSFSQKRQLKDFSNEFSTYLAELDGFMTSTNNDRLELIYKKFSDQFDNYLSDNEKVNIIKISKKMLSKRLRPNPHFLNLFSTIVIVKNSDKGDVLLLDWLKVFEETLDGSTTNKLMLFCTFTADLVGENTLRESNSAHWKISNTDFHFKFEMIEPVVVFETPFNLSCSTNNGSYTIFSTKGKYYSISNQWIGEDGLINWESHGYSKDSIFSRIKSYNIDTRKNKVVADSSIFYDKSVFMEPIVGKLVNKIARGRQSDMYPKFTSYSKDIELKEIFPNIDYRGGYKMQGKDFVADGGDYAEARIVFKRDGKDVFIANANRFSIGADRIVSQQAGVRIFFDNDSIYHGNLQFKYIDSKRQLQLYRDVNGLSSATMLNTYHNVTMDFELLQWNIDQDIINFGSLPGTAVSRVSFESIARFDSALCAILGGIDAVHPLFLLNNYVNEKQEEKIYVEDFARFARFPLNQIRSLLIRLSRYGFIFYDFGLERITVLPKLYNYVNAASDLGDYDVISFNSVIKPGEYNTGDKYLVNAALNLENKDLNILGIHNIEVSSKRKVYLYPKDGLVVLKKNRDFIFNGQIFVGKGRLNLYGREFEFHYDDFKVDLNYIDSVQLAVPILPIRKDMYGNEFLTPVRTIIEAVTGDLRIDDPSNKSGIRKDSFPEFPIFSSHYDSYAYYDKNSIFNGVYNRDRFSFHLEPFTIDSLDNYSGKGLWFAGTFESAGIFPSFDDTLRLQKDYSLGFNRKTPDDGFVIYGGKGKYYNDIHLSHKGLKGSGDFEYLTSKASANEIFFFPDSTNLYTQKFEISEVLTGIEFPEVNNTETYAHFEPYNDRLNIDKIKDEFNFYNSQAKFSGSLLIRPTGVTGGGIMSLDKASLTANLFTFNANWFQSENSNLDVFSDNRKLAIEAVNLKSHVDLKMREGIFNSIGHNSYVNFPKNQYLAYIDKLKWDMDKQTFVLGNEIASVGNLTKFVSTNPFQDSLSFESRTAFYSLKDFIINTKGVDEISVADAIIYPDSGALTIAKNAVIETLYNARVLADNLTQYHTFADASVDIKSRHEYIASGNYTYKDAMRNEQNIFFKEIRVDADTITIALGDVPTNQVFHIDSKFDFKGSVNLIADQRSLIFDGFFRINHKCDFFDKEWVRFNSPVDPQNANIKLDSVLVNDKNDKLFTGIMMRQDTFKIYSTFFTKRKSVMDLEMISSDYSLSYNKRISAFVINGRDSLDNTYTMYENTCKIRGEGEIDMTLDLGDVSVKSMGVINHDLINNKTSFKGFVLVDFFFSDQSLFKMAEELCDEDGCFGYEDYDEIYVNNLKRLLRDRARASQFILDLNENKINKIPSELSTTFAFTDINMIWDNKNKAFVNKDRFGLGNILDNPIGEYYDGLVVFEKKHTNSGDGMSILVDVGNKFWFKYQSNRMNTFSYSTEFEQAIKSISQEKRRKEGRKFNYSFRGTNDDNAYNGDKIYRDERKALYKKY